MKRKALIKLIAVLSVFCLVFGANVPMEYVSASGTSLEQRREELDKKLKDAEQKLAELGRQSEETEAYIETLGDKIAYLTEQFQLSKKEADKIESEVTALEKNIAVNENEILSMSDEIKTLEQNVRILDKEFQQTYLEYSQRIRAIYISGQQGSVLTFLITSHGLEDFLTRMQMVNAISKRDGELLQTVRTQTDEITKAKETLSDRTKTLKETQKTLKNNKQQLKTRRVTLLKNQEELQAQQAVIEAQQETQNGLLQKLHNKTKKYGEFRDLTKEELDEIDADIAAADAKYRDATTTTTTKRTTATTKPSTTKSGSPTQKETTTQKTTTTTTTATGSYIKLTYPCPSYTTITCGYGAYPGHTGCDFSTWGNVNCKIVAAEAGTVIISADLTNPDGTYRSYGRYIVIRHDKTTSSGKSVYTLYAHNNSRLVSAGQHVKKGQQIAYSGSTGNSTGPHCHFEVRIGGPDQYCAQNPANYLP